MARDNRTAVIIGAVDRETAEEALRAAVGLTLRRARVLVVMTRAIELGPKGLRARHALETFKHRVAGPEALREALEHPRVEIWGPLPASRHAAPSSVRRAHLVRPGRAAAAVASGDTVIHLDRILDDDTADRLLDVLDTAVVW